jgi:membrane fusion protein (multidrug efflux system)
MKILLLLSLLLVACSKDNPPPKRTEAEVAYVRLQSEALPNTEVLNGRVVSTLTAEIRPQVTGIIQKRLFVEGAQVKAGDVLYQIDAATYQSTLDQATAALANAQAAVSAEQLKSARYDELLVIQGVSKQDADDAKVSYLQAMAAVEQSKAAVKLAKINLNYTTIRAPISGRIGTSTITAGALVTANQTNALAVIRVLNPINVDLTQSSTELLRLKKALANGTGSAGSKTIKLILPDGSYYDKTGILKFSEIAVDESTDMVTLRAEFPNTEQTLLPGMFVRAEVDQAIHHDAILAPQQAITRNPKGDATAMVLNANNRIESRVVVTDKAIEDKWVIASGLKVGEKVIVEGLNKIKAGDTVKAVDLTQQFNQKSAHTLQKQLEVAPTTPKSIE